MQYIFILLIAFIVGSTSAFAQQTLVDSAHNSVTVAEPIARIADAWPAHNAIVTMLGYGDKIVATIVTREMCPWLYKINPRMSQATIAFTGGMTSSTEELLKVKPDVVFVSSSTKNTEVYKNLGLSVVVLSLTDFSSLKECVLLTGKILGKEALEKAERYGLYLDQTTQRIKERLKDISQNQKPKVLHLSDISSSFVADGAGSMMDSWIQLAGGVNVAGELRGANRPVSAEQIIAWNPDIVIIGSTTQMVQASNFLNNPIFKNLSATKSKKVFINPKGMFFWDRYSAEGVLQVQWAAQIFYPERFKEFDIVQETISFYNTFFSYSLTNEEAKMILEGIPPSQ